MQTPGHLYHDASVRGRGERGADGREGIGGNRGKEREKESQKDIHEYSERIQHNTTQMLGQIFSKEK